MARVVNIDHISVRVSNFARSKKFYTALFGFLGFKVLDEFEDAIGWTNGGTRYWIGAADTQGRRHKHRTGDVGLHHKMSMRCRTFLSNSAPRSSTQPESTMTTTTRCSSSIPTD